MSRPLRIVVLACLCVAGCGEMSGTQTDAAVDASRDAAGDMNVCIWDLWSLRDKPCDSPGQMCTVSFDLDTVHCTCDAMTNKWSCEMHTFTPPDFSNMQDMTTPPG